MSSPPNRISFKSLARRYLELHDEIADLDAMIGAIVDELAPNLVARNSIGQTGAAQLLLTAGANPERALKRYLAREVFMRHCHI
jgi:transposase